MRLTSPLISVRCIVAASVVIFALSNSCILIEENSGGNDRDAPRSRYNERAMSKTRVYQRFFCFGNGDLSESRGQPRSWRAVVEPNG